MNPKISSKFTKVGQTNIHYLVAGKGPTILLLHGWPTSSYLWRNIMPDLAETHQVIAIDLPGFGQSDKRLEDSFSFRYYERILDGFLTNLSIDKLILGVHDLGGPLGLFWAVNNKARIEKLILFNTLVYPKLSWAVKLFGFATMVPGLNSLLTSQNGINRAMHFGLHPKTRLSKETIQQYQAPFKTKTARKVLLKTVQGLSPKGFVQIAKELAQFNCPVQIIYGERDRILPKVAQTMEQVKIDLPQAMVLSFEDCGHFLQEEKPEQITAALRAFLSQ